MQSRSMFPLVSLKAAKQGVRLVGSPPFQSGVEPEHFIEQAVIFRTWKRDWLGRILVAKDFGLKAWPIYVTDIDRSLHHPNAK